MLPEVLLVVSGEVHQVHQQERLHHGERTSCEKKPLILTISVSFSTLNMIKFVLLSLHNLSSISLESENHFFFFFFFVRLPFMGKTSVSQPKMLFSCS